ncbi:MAG TPA: hypothetical protein VKZ18_09105 [Polyangia bacterium]|nr:hypothetical protein [Polyangia bacterium]
MSSFWSQASTTPLVKVWALLALPPDQLVPALSLLAFVIVIAELVRIAIGTELTRSALAHVTVCLLTFALQSVLLAVVLVHAAHAYPTRGFVNLAFAAGLYLVWYLAGQATKLVRPVSEGADVGFMAVGALITFPAGLVAALVFRATGA